MAFYRLIMNNTTVQATSMAGKHLPTFDALMLTKPLLKALDKSGYITPTPIQAQAIPHALSGRDLLLSAQTGSGKTAAFVLPILDKLSRQRELQKHIHALILVPTRELAQQVQESVRRYGANIKGLYSIALVGGTPYSGQIRALRKGVQVVIATPGRLIDHMNEARVDLSNLDVLVLDEADRMLDMGFADDIKTILQAAPTTRQTIMSSATWDGQVGKIAESFTNNPERVSIKVESAHIDESVYFCDDFHHKNKILLELLNGSDINQAVIFAATKRSTEQLSQTLTEAGLSARYLHGDLPQGKRNRIISDVKSGKCHFLIATDVAARGIDIATISHVVNYDLPRQVEDYVHRIGRCGRAGRTGVAMNLCSRDDHRQLNHINRYLGRDMKTCVITGLEPKFTPKKGDDKRKNTRKKFDKNERFGRRADKSGDFYQTSRERAFGKFGKIDSLYERFGRLECTEKSEHFGKKDKGFDGTERGYHPKSGLYGKKTRQAVSDGVYQAKSHASHVKGAKRDDGFKGRSLGSSFVRAERDFDGAGKKVRGDGVGKKSFHASYAKKQKPIEEVFFNKRQAKKSRRFGDL